MTEHEKIERIVKLTLIRLGIKCDLIGFSYLATSTVLVIEQPMKVYNLKRLFKEVAEIYNVKNPFRVEANIQNAISMTYNTKGFDTLNDIYGMKVFDGSYKPTTAEMIKLLAEYYNLGLYREVN